MTSTILAISPHLDDAVFSLGGYLFRKAREGVRVVIATVFTGSVDRPTGFALACQTDKGLTADADYMAIRRAEDEAACALIGATPVHLGFLEAPHRGYDSAAALFAEPWPERALEDRLARAIESLRRNLDCPLIFGPEAIGDHVDHLLVRRVLDRSSENINLWADAPYTMRSGWQPAEQKRIGLDVDETDRKRQAIEAYRSQLGFQFPQGVDRGSISSEYIG
ncbi:MAG: PIG-L family deacetylase [Pacificimonas sp.]